MLDRLADLVLARAVAFGLQRTGGITTAAATDMTASSVTGDAELEGATS